uniref:High-mobility-group family protein n=1 Tax=Rhizophora mucronata TaxID=61149 RepID=A0A2P2INS3_RHIMU
MATAEGPSNPQLPAQQQQTTAALPSYSDMILAAIDALNDKNGSNKTTIGKQIEVTHPDLPVAHATLLAHHLNKMRQSGQIVFFKNNYMRPDPNAPPKRGRGRPPKPKHPLPPGTVVAPPRPRGRPPKSRDPLAPVAPPKMKSSGGSGRPRGRPPKKDKTAAARPSAPSAASVIGRSPRGRGRPPKVKPAVAPVAG